MTGKQRIRRIDRLVSIRERDRDSARGELADAQRRAEDASRSRAAAEDRWQAEAELTAAPPEQLSIQDFALQRMHLSTLRREAERAQHRHERAVKDEDKKRELATFAQTELRKMELWSDTERERQRVEAQSRDQKITDEHAAQLVHTTSR